MFLDANGVVLVDISDLFPLSPLQSEFLHISVDSSLSTGDLCPVPKMASEVEGEVRTHQDLLVQLASWYIVGNPV